MHSLYFPPLISVHEREPLLSEEQLYSVAEQVLEYVYLEEDVRGYVEGKGWAHSTAHAADALDALTYNTKIVSFHMRFLQLFVRKFA